MTWTDLKSDRLSWLQLGTAGKEPLTDIVDPYLLWADLTDFAGYSGIESFAQKIPLAIEVKKPGDIGKLFNAGRIETPEVYRNSQGRHFTAYVQPKNLAALARESVVERMELGLPLPFLLLDRGSVLSEASEVPASKETPHCIFGVIDLGCGFLNRVFCQKTSALKTRLRALWHQGCQPPDPPLPGPGTWSFPAGFGYGRELLRKDIDALLASTQGDPVKERKVYQSLDYLHDEHGQLERRAHGTFVFDTGSGLVDPNAGRASSKPDADDCASDLADLIFVDIPRARTNDTSSASLCVHIIDALHYIVDRADGAKKIVVNLSIGGQAGPHDGSSLIEKAIDELVERQRAAGLVLVVVMAAGNGADVPCHATGKIAPAAGAEFMWRLLPEDKTDSFLEIWYDQSRAGLVEVQVHSPDGQASGWVAPGQGKVWEADKSVVGAVLHCQKAATGKGPMIAVMMAPGKASAGRTQITDHGLWRIELSVQRVGKESVEPEVDFYAWVERDDPPVGDPNVKRQSFLLDVQSKSYVQKTAGSVNNIATGDWPIVVAAYDLATEKITPYSGKASKRGKRSRGAQVMAPADESSTLEGLEAAGLLSGQRFRMSGTSVAAPFVARQVVRLLCCEGWPSDPNTWTRKDLVKALTVQPQAAGNPRTRGSVGTLPRSRTRPKKPGVRRVKR